ncbi:protein of unknown function [Streptantibioticus cattleyicolor NRRL 8057 = DSM 46488]|nr:protein of unknown function [Streptantibioticus cattleyicolor NRRL 8057 = DSM 46488]
MPGDAETSRPPDPSEIIYGTALRVGCPTTSPVRIAHDVTEKKRKISHSPAMHQINNTALHLQEC